MTSSCKWYIYKHLSIYQIIYLFLTKHLFILSNYISIFTKHLSILLDHISIFTKHLSILLDHISIFNKSSAHFTVIRYTKCNGHHFLQMDYQKYQYHWYHIKDDVITVNIIKGESIWVRTIWGSWILLIGWSVS